MGKCLQIILDSQFNTKIKEQLNLGTYSNSTGSYFGFKNSLQFSSNGDVVFSLTNDIKTASASLTINKVQQVYIFNKKYPKESEFSISPTENLASWNCTQAININDLDKITSIIDTIYNIGVGGQLTTKLLNKVQTQLVYSYLQDEASYLFDYISAQQFNLRTGTYFIGKNLVDSKNILKSIILSNDVKVDIDLESLSSYPLLKTLGIPSPTQLTKVTWSKEDLRDYNLPMFEITYNTLFESPEDVDNYLINMSKCSYSKKDTYTYKSINIQTARTNRSDDAVTILKNRGFTININNKPQ